MKNISTEFKAHLAGELTTLANMWKITRKDGVVMGFTDHDSNLTYDSLQYEASTGMTPTAIATKSDFSVDNLDVDGILDSLKISEQDILEGKYDFAELEVFTVNYEDLSQGKMIQRVGWLGEVTLNKGQFVAEVRGLNQKLLQNIGNVYTPSCRALLGDSKCKVNLADFTSSGSVTTVSNKQKFSSSDLSQNPSYFSGGEILWNSGNNSGLKMEVKEFRNEEVVLALPMPKAISIGDSFSIVAGCDKSESACKNKFSNIINFRGFPKVPGTDKILQTAGTIERQ